MLSAVAASEASPATVWQLLAEPGLWPRWAPHIRGAIGLGSPEVQQGRRGVVLLGLGLPVPVRIAAKTPGQSWDWTTGVVRIRHAVEPRPTGCMISVALSAPFPVEQALKWTYGPLLGPLMRNLARIAEGHR